MGAVLRGTQSIRRRPLPPGGSRHHVLALRGRGVGVHLHHDLPLPSFLAMRRAVDPLSARSFPLWFGVLAPPLAWGAHLVLGDLIFELGCSPGVRGHILAGLSLETWALIQTTVAAVIIVSAGLFAAAAWRRIVATSNGTAWNRAHALALAGMASGLIYLALILYGFLAPLFLKGCTTSP